MVEPEQEVSNAQCQVITDDLEYYNGFGPYLKSKDIFKAHANDYRTVAVIGCQSSGKSKLDQLKFMCFLQLRYFAQHAFWHAIFDHGRLNGSFTNYKGHLDVLRRYRKDPNFRY